MVKKDTSGTVGEKLGIRDATSDGKSNDLRTVLHPPVVKIIARWKPHAPPPTHLSVNRSFFGAVY